MMTTREDTLDAWNDYQDAVAHCSDTATERASQKEQVYTSMIKWSNLNTGLVAAAVVVLPLSFLFAVGGISLLLNLTGLAVGVLCIFAIVYSHKKYKTLRASFDAFADPEQAVARKHREFITTVADELQTQGYAILDLNPSAKIPYIVTDSGIATVVIANNTPEIRIGNQIIYSTYRDTSVEAVMHTRAS